MARKVFVSYKYSDAVDTRDKIIKVLKNNGTYYKGEHGYVELKFATSTLKKYLADKIYDSTVTVVVISPNVASSKWVEWEINYSLERQTRNGKTANRNGIVCVIQKKADLFGNYNSNWAYDTHSYGKALNPLYFPKLIKRNMQKTFKEIIRGSFISDIFFNQSNIYKDDYCVVVAESTFLSNPNVYIEKAYERANNVNYVTNTR